MDLSSLAGGNEFTSDLVFYASWDGINEMLASD